MILNKSIFIRPINKDGEEKTILDISGTNVPTFVFITIQLILNHCIWYQNLQGHLIFFN